MNTDSIPPEQRVHKMLTRDRIQELAISTVKNEGILLAHVLVNHGEYDGGNLVALLEVFADKLEAAQSEEIVGVIDARLGPGWTRRLAEALK